jgi:hypothetical protein
MTPYPSWPGNGLQHDGGGNARHLDLPIGSRAKSFRPAAPVVAGDVQHTATCRPPPVAGGSLAMKRTTLTAARRAVHRLLGAVGRQLPAPRRAGKRRSVWCGAAPGWNHAADCGYKAPFQFVEDSPGQVNGTGFQDQSGGRHFTWHAVLSSGAVALPAAQATAKTPVQSTSRSYGCPY